MAGTFTYTYDPTNVPIDAVRLTLQDTDEDEVFLYDEEIDYFLTKSAGSVLHASLLGARAIMAKFARLATREQARNYQVYFTNKIGDYQALIESIQDQIGSDSGIELQYGGVEMGATDAVRHDPSLVGNLFTNETLLSRDLRSPEHKRPRLWQREHL